MEQEKEKRPAVFLDRDGTINRDAHHLNQIEQVEILPRAAKAIERLNKLGLMVVVVTNQSAIARGVLTHEGLDSIHAVIIDLLDKENAKIDAIYYCPHHPEGIVPEHAIDCTCRKPKTGMIDKAAADHPIDLDKSFLVGDTTGDVLAGSRAGLKTILVRTGYGGSDKKHEVNPDFIADDLFGAVDIIEKELQRNGA